MTCGSKNKCAAHYTTAPHGFQLDVFGILSSYLFFFIACCTNLQVTSIGSTVSTLNEEVTVGCQYHQVLYGMLQTAFYLCYVSVRQRNLNIAC